MYSTYCKHDEVLHTLEVFFFLNAHHVEQITAEKDGFCEIQYACKHAVTLCQKNDIHLVMYNFSFLH